jgi:glutathione peroxidase
MRIRYICTALGATLALAAAAGPAVAPLLDRTLPNIDGKPVRLAGYQGKVLVIVNTASRCGYTPQYQGLEELYGRYKSKGLVVLGFPSNDFGGQEPGTNAEIKRFCTGTYKVTFPMFGKIHVTGPEMDPLYRYLTTPPTAGEFGGPVQWNFTKFLVARNGAVVGRFPSNVTPLSPEMISAVEKALGPK